MESLVGFKVESISLLEICFFLIFSRAERHMEESPAGFVEESEAKGSAGEKKKRKQRVSGCHPKSPSFGGFGMICQL